MMTAIVESNKTRKDFIVSQIFEKLENNNRSRVGVFRLTMKANADNYRNSSILGIIERLLEKDVEVIIYEPLIESEEFLGCKVINDLDLFKTKSDLIITNRFESEIEDVIDKVYTRDL